MCNCTSDDPFECDARRERYACACSCHRRWKPPVASNSTPGPKQPLDEKDAEIQRLRSMLAYVARCLSVSDFCVDDRDYVASLARYINERIPPTKITDTYISEQTMERLYEAVQLSLDEKEQ